VALLRNTVALAFGVAGALGLSQAPEFSQQYRQRLGGAMDELARVVVEFDADAAKNGLTRELALATYQQSDQQFLKDRGARMASTIGRMELLSAQARWFETLPPLVRPVALARGYDEALMAGMWRDYEPGVPLTTDGAVWAGGGFLLAAGMLGLLTMPFARWKRRRQIRKEAEALLAAQQKKLDAAKRQAQPTRA
jgi:hypothetical protein